MSGLPLFDRLAIDRRGGDDALRERLIAFMRGRGFCRKSMLCAHLGVGDRVLRDVISRSDGEIIGLSGRPGYTLIDEAPVEDVRHSAAELRSRARHLLNRAVAIERRAHHRLHVPADARGAA